jgi:hypothetical protein
MLINPEIPLGVTISRLCIFGGDVVTGEEMRDVWEPMDFI